MSTMVDPDVAADRMSLRHAAGTALHLPGSLVRGLLLGLLWLYRNGISPLLGPRCRYYPSCSATPLRRSCARTGRQGQRPGRRPGCCRCHPWAPAGSTRPGPGRWRAEVRAALRLVAGDTGATTPAAAALSRPYPRTLVTLLAADAGCQ